MARRLVNTPRPAAIKDLGCAILTGFTFDIFRSARAKVVYRISLPHYLVKDSSILLGLVPRRFASFNKTFWTPLEYWTAFFGRSTTLSGKLKRAASLLRTYFRITFPLASLTRRDAGSFRAYSTSGRYAKGQQNSRPAATASLSPGSKSLAEAAITLLNISLPSLSIPTCSAMPSNFP